MFIPTYLKVIYGYLSDTFPILKSKRKSYIMIYYSILAICYMFIYIYFIRLYGFVVKSYITAIITGFFLELGMAGFELMIDTMVVEKVQKDPKDTGKLQVFYYIYRVIV